ncbi:transcription antitermination factor NusB [Bacillus sp. B15-48]|uniref:transcription antitermination factor NusB n=1 Tax=Bacillus sp. B15-48 TaxID=1548601 RepID=UPI00193F69CD|nr:transcription antitermination factor NusB [Bacillus sp. B15-48]MBM4762243.1 transcription antitermination factor NusB [Bacillus sp. B15-48]
MKRRTAREKALQALFQIDISKVEIVDAIDHVLDEEKSDPYLSKLVEGTVQNQQEIDNVIKAHLEKWTMDRLAPVDRSLLRLAVFEMLHCKEVPTNVVLDEAIEIAKIYGDDQSSRFINGVLSKVKQNYL